MELLLLLCFQNTTFCFLSLQVLGSFLIISIQFNQLHFTILRLVKLSGLASWSRVKGMVITMTVNNFFQIDLISSPVFTRVVRSLTIFFIGSSSSDSLVSQLYQTCCSWIIAYYHKSLHALGEYLCYFS